MPKVNIRESDDDFSVEVAAPGMNKEDFHISLDNDILTIGYETSRNFPNAEEEKEQQYSRREFNYQSFKRTFHLPNTVEHEKIEAKYQEGILSLTIPKKEEAKKKPIRRISIS